MGKTHITQYIMEREWLITDEVDSCFGDPSSTHWAIPVEQLTADQLAETCPKCLKHWIYQKQLIIGEQASLLQVANCPQCGDKSGAHYDHNGDASQCQWCYEVSQTKTKEAT